MKEKSKPLCTTKSEQKSKLKFSKIAVIVVLVQVFLYTWVHLILSTIVGMEIAPTTSCAFYTFCGAEAGLLAWIRKINKQNDRDEDDSDDSDDSDDQNNTEDKPHERDFSEKIDQS